VRSLRNVKPKDLKAAMGSLNLNEASRTMSGNVGFVLAIPILEPEETRRFTAPTPVAGVIYIDNSADGFFIGDNDLQTLVSMTNQFLVGLETTRFDRIRNVLTGLGTDVPPAERLPDEVQHVLELVSEVAPPKMSKPFQFNFDCSDFVPVQR
jgi:hypothetical protein